MTDTIQLPPDEELLRRALKNFKRPVTRGGVPLFGLGSGYSRHLCKRLGLDPEEMVRKP
jgi:hypothetical protein